MINNEERETAIQLILEGETLKAMEFIRSKTPKKENVQKDLMLLISKMNQIDKNSYLGLMTREEHRVETTIITRAFQNILDEVTYKNNRNDLAKRGRQIVENEEYANLVKKFQSSISSINEVEKIVKELFDLLKIEVPKFSSESNNLRLTLSTNPREEFERNIVFGEKGSLLLLWERKLSNSLKGSCLTLCLMDRPFKFGSYPPFPQYVPKQVLQKVFEPTLSRDMRIMWILKGSGDKHLENSDIIEECFRLIISRLEKI